MEQIKYLLQSIEGKDLPEDTFDKLKVKIMPLTKKTSLLEIRSIDPRYIEGALKTNTTVRFYEKRKAIPPMIRHPIITIEFSGEQKNIDDTKHLFESELKFQLDPYKN